MIGERMGCGSRREMTTIVTHPEWTRRGYASALIAHLAEVITNVLRSK